MMTLTPLVEELMRGTEWQRTPTEITSQDYFAMIVKGIEYLYMLTGRGTAFSDDMIDAENQTFSGNLNLTEKMIVLWSAEIDLLEKVRADKNAIVGYTTDAISITNADKPYQYLSQSIDELRQKIRTAFYKLTAFVGE